MPRALRTVDNCDRTVASRRLPLLLVCLFFFFWHSMSCCVSVKAVQPSMARRSIPVSGLPRSGLAHADGLTNRINCTEVQPSEERVR